MTFLFDIDGTLTYPVQEITDLMIYRIIELVRKGHNVFIVAGSNLKKLRHQAGDKLLSEITGYFCSSGAEFYIKGEKIYSLPNPSTSIYPKLQKIFQDGITLWSLVHKDNTPTQIEVRPGMLNFCPVGREADISLRNKFIKYDETTKFRDSIVSKLESLDVPIIVVKGGQVSIDIYFDDFTGKDFAINHLIDSGYSDFVYFGDKMKEDGNDLPAAKAILESNTGCVIAVKSPSETLKWINIIDSARLPS